MRLSLRELILQSYDALSALFSAGAAPGAGAAWREWAQDWPGQVLLVAAFIVNTQECLEAIKGGSVALKAFADMIVTSRNEMLDLMTEFGDKLLRHTMAAMINQSMMYSDLVKDLLDREVRSEKDFGWKVKPR